MVWESVSRSDECGMKEDFHRAAADGGSCGMRSDRREEVEEIRAELRAVEAITGEVGSPSEASESGAGSVWEEAGRNSGGTEGAGRADSGGDRWESGELTGELHERLAGSAMTATAASDSGSGACSASSGWGGGALGLGTGEL
jgi:curli biogenesis system outer membrane secretion channel CsgG